MKNSQQFLAKRQTASPYDNRLKIFIEEYRKYKEKHKKPITILDIGCGKDVFLHEFVDKKDKYYGCDYYSKINVKLTEYRRIDLNEESLAKVFSRKKFDVIFCGEVVEHLFSPDDLIDEIKSLMTSKSILIFSTPNLGYYMNRILLLFGISPLFLENSSEKKLGRKFSFLGQGNLTEGHIRLFTYGALIDFFKMKKLKIINVRSTYIWNFWPDKVVSRFSKSLSADNVFVLKK